MNKAELEAALRKAAHAMGAAPADARKPKRGKVSLAVQWLRPEPVALRADAARGVLVLEDYLPFVLAGGTLHRRLKVFVDGKALLVSRNGHVSIAMPVDGDWGAALSALLTLAREVAAMLQSEWPDYASGVFAPALA
jgi:hypothetical protein